MRITLTGLLEKNVTRQMISPPSATESGDDADAVDLTETPSGLRKQTLRVFLADDSQLVMERVSALLATVAGVQIIGSAQTVRAAIRGIQHLSPDLVILDFQLPDGTGKDVLKAIKQSTAPPLVVMLTNVSSPLYRTECMLWGADYFFDKSREFEQVIEVCKNLLSVMRVK